MRLKITLQKENCKVPLGYQYMLQGIIYRLLQDTNLGDFYHNVGYNLKEKTFKCFAYSNLYGEYRIEDRNLVFVKDFYFYLSSQDETFMQAIYSKLQQLDTLIFINQEVKITKLDIFNIKPFEGVKEVTLKTLSPILVYSTEGRQSTYYDLTSYKSSHYILQNIRNKSLAYGYPIDEPIFEITDVVNQKKRMVRYKKCIYPSYTAILKVRLDFPTLQFIYNCGLGSKNACGFGMIDIAKERKRVE